MTTRKLVISGVLGAICIIMGAVPVLGFIPVPTPAGHATIMHVPVILAGILEGPAAGAFVGFIFGLFSFLRPGAPFFSDPLIAFLPRILIGVLAFYAYRVTSHYNARTFLPALLGLGFAVVGYQAVGSFSGAGQNTILAFVVAVVLGVLAGYLAFKYLRGRDVSSALAAIVGTLTNTVGVLTLIVWRGYLPGEVALGIGVLHGIPEVLVATLVVVLICRPLIAVRKKEVT